MLWITYHHHYRCIPAVCSAGLSFGFGTALCWSWPCCCQHPKSLPLLWIPTSSWPSCSWSSSWVWQHLPSSTLSPMVCYKACRCEWLSAGKQCQKWNREINAFQKSWQALPEAPATACIAVVCFCLLCPVIVCSGINVVADIIWASCFTSPCVKLETACWWSGMQQPGAFVPHMLSLMCSKANTLFACCCIGAGLAYSGLDGNWLFVLHGSQQCCQHSRSRGCGSPSRARDSQHQLCSSGTGPDCGCWRQSDQTLRSESSHLDKKRLIHDQRQLQ